VIQETLVQVGQLIVGVGLVLYGLYEGWKRLPAFRLPSFGKGGDSDVHTVVNISIRLDEAGKTRAADLARGLVQEMLSPAKKV
jgi:hypothetical protein